MSTTVVITGSTAGIGKFVFCTFLTNVCSMFRETARELVKRGYHVILACRNRQAAVRVAHELSENGNVEVGPTLDLTSLKSVRDFANELKEQEINILVNNAGGHYPPDQISDEGVPLTMQVNYVATFLLTHLLIPNLLKSHTQPQVINVASVLHRLGKISALDRFMTDEKDGDYQNAKLALVMFTHEMQRQYGSKIDFTAVDPGGVNTKIFDGTPFGKQPFRWMIQNFYSTPEDAALTIIDALTAPKRATESNFFARGIFTWPIITSYHGHTPTLPGNLRYYLFSIVLGFLSLFDYPLRHWLGQRQAEPVPPLQSSLNQQQCEELCHKTKLLVGL